MEPFLAEIKIFSFNFAPKGWALCNGQFIPINQNQALFALLGTTYGGNGQTNFALPDFRARAPIHFGNGHNIGERAGEQAHTINISELPQHRHLVQVKTDAVSTNIPSNQTIFGNTAPNQVYNGTGENLVSMNNTSLSSIGGSQAHLNMQPYLALNFCIALLGVFPSQN